MTQPVLRLEDSIDAREREVRERCEQGDMAAATTLALRLYGRELLQFLIHTQRDEQAASDVYALMAEDVWRGMAGFRWQGTLRAWIYAIARNASHQLRKSERRHTRSIPMSDRENVFLEVVAQIRTETLTFLRTESRTALDKLRDELTVDERMLLSLRIDRGLSWPEIAAIHEGDEGDVELDAARRAARLRKRFQLLKDRLRKRGRELGLLPSGGDAA
jgi:RNA polymerase sigma-70 factor, ECF subfamily